MQKQIQKTRKLALKIKSKSRLLMKYYIKRVLQIIILSFVTILSFAQQSIYTIDAFLTSIKKNHPVAKQANIIVNKASAEIQSAKGSFDPLLELDALQKTFDGKNYYQYSSPELKIPTNLPLDIKTGFETNDGLYLNPEYSKGKSSYIGVEIALAKGFMIDKRRAALQQTKILFNQSEQEKRIVINNLLFEAYNDYWQWTGAFKQYKIYNKFLENATTRLRLIKLGFINGERSEMDTIEAFNQLNSYQLLETEALLKLKSCGFQLSTYLWDEQEKPYLLPESYIPDTLLFASQLDLIEPVDYFLTQSNNKSPFIKSYESKIESLNIEKKLKFQNLLPYFNVKANVLSKGYYEPKKMDGAYFEKNYKWGFDFKMPLLFREGRGEYSKAKLKIKEANLELAYKKCQIENKIRYYHTEINLLQQQLNTMLSIYSNSVLLLKNEELKFAQGESTLFLINSRENKVLEVAQKQIDLTVKYKKAKYAVDWVAGLL